MEKKLTDFDREVMAHRATARGFHSHAGSCKKTPDECKPCKTAIRWFGALPALTLSRVLAE